MAGRLDGVKAAGPAQGGVQGTTTGFGIGVPGDLTISEMVGRGTENETMFV